MPLQVVKIIREFTDTVSNNLQTRQSFCYTEIVRPDAAFWQPRTDIFETDDEVVIKLELAGVNKKDISVKLKNGELIVTGLRRENRPEKSLYFHQLEISYGPFEKIIFLPEALQHNEIVAQYDEGMLFIVISKKSQTIEIPIDTETEE